MRHWPAEMREESASLFRSARLIGGMTLLSRILGMVRDILTSHFFGAGLVWDAFTTAYRVPNLFRRLFGEGALTAAFVPAFVSRLETGRKEEAFALLRRLATLLALVLGAAAAIGIGASFLLPADSEWQLVGRYGRIMLPYLPLICVAAILGGALNGLRHFFTPAFAPILLNLTWIAAIVAFVAAPRESAGAWVAGAITTGGALQLGAMALALVARGVPPAPQGGFGDPALREVGARFAPMVFGLSLAQMNEFLNTILAQALVPGDGAVSALYYGNQLMQLPLSLVGTSVATAAVPALSAAAAQGRTEEFGALVGRALRGTLHLAIPATVGLLLFARPIVEALFEHGRFDAAATDRAAAALFFYALGLWCYCANQVQVRVFYAKGDTRTPVRISASMVAVSLGVGTALVGPMGEAGIALGTSAGGLGSFVLLQIALRRRAPELRMGPVVRGVAVSLAAAAAMAGAAWGVRELLPESLGRYARLGIPIAAAVVTYFGIAALLGARSYNRAIR